MQCCDGNCQPCDQQCNKSLGCKNHKCSSRCHRGPCYPCPLTETICCACKGTRITVPCGREKVTRPPRCTKFCKLVFCRSICPICTPRTIWLPPATKLGQGYVFTGVCDSVHRGGVPDQVHPPGPGTPPQTRYTPPDQVHPPWDHPLVHPPGPGTPPRDQEPGTPPQTRYTPLGPGTPPPGAEHAGRYGLRAGGTHPTGMQSGIRSCKYPVP